MYFRISYKMNAEYIFRSSIGCEIMLMIKARIRLIFSRYMYITHFYCLAVEAGFYSDVLECLPVDPVTWVRFPAGAGKIFSLYDNGAHRKKAPYDRSVHKYLPWSHFT